MTVRFLLSFLLIAVASVQAQFLFEARVAAQVMTDEPTPTFFAGGEQGLFQSTDERKSWQPVALLPIDRPQPEIAHLVFDPNRMSRIYAAGTTPGAAVFRSDNNGDAWTQVTSGLPEDGELVQFYATNDAIYVQMMQDNRRRVYKSVDLGESWALQAVVPETSTHLEIHPLNS